VAESQQTEQTGTVAVEAAAASATPPAASADKGREGLLHEEEIERFFPHEIVKFALIITLIVAALTFLASLVPIQVGQPADPQRTPAGTEPEWYFMAVYQLLKYVPRWLGILFSFIFFPICLIIVPFLWNRITRWNRGVWVLHFLAGLAVAVALVLTLLAFLGFE
jgi:cytochrome b6-f complex subunit 4